MAFDAVYELAERETEGFLAIKVVRFHREHVFRAVCAALRTQLVGFICNARLATDEVRCVRTTPDSSVSRYEGYWRPTGTKRIVARLAIAPDGLLRIGPLVATHGELDASQELMLEAPAIDARIGGRGNPLLVARALHVALVSLKRSGVTAIRINPIPNEKVRRRYCEMGFSPMDWTMSFDDAGSLLRCLEYVFLTYVDHVADIAPQASLSLARA